MEIRHKVLIKATARYVFISLTQIQEIKKWLTPVAEGRLKAQNKSGFTISGRYLMAVNLIELIPGSFLEWQISLPEQNSKYVRIIFEIHASNLEVTVNFTYAEYDHSNGFPTFNYDWELFLASLKAFCEFGKGFQIAKTDL